MSSLNQYSQDNAILSTVCKNKNSLCVRIQNTCLDFESNPYRTSPLLQVFRNNFSFHLEWPKSAVSIKKNGMKGSRCVTAALRVFNAKNLAQLTYRTLFGIKSNCNWMEIIQSTFQRGIFQVPTSIMNAANDLDAGLVTVEARLWIATILY